MKPQANFCALGIAAQCGVPHLPRVQGHVAWPSAQQGRCRKHPCSGSLDMHEPFQTACRRLRHPPKAESEAAGPGWWGLDCGGCSCLEAWKAASFPLALGEGGQNPWSKPVFLAYWRVPSQWGFLSKTQQLH